MRSGTRTSINLEAMRRPTEPWQLKMRQPDGRYCQETATEIRSVAVASRRRLGVSDKDVLDPLAGSRYGRLRLRQQITEDQYQAGIRWEGIVRRYAGVLGIPSPHPKSASLGNGGGLSCSEITDELANSTKRDYADTYSALISQTDGTDMLKAMKAIILMDHLGDVGALRCGLNVLLHLWR